MEERKISNINIDDILPSRMQPRLVFNNDAIDELAESIKKHGIINPITVRRINDKYEIISGERRYKASQSIGLKEMPAIVVDADDKKTAELALIENVQRKELSPIEEGKSYERILQIGDMTQAELSQQLGKNQSTIANKMRLLKLDESVQDALLNERISERHARSLLKLYNKKDQKEMLDKIINERLTVRQADQEIDKIIKEKEEIIDMNKNFDLPTGDFILDKEKEELKEPGTEINPSFVDVKKIEETSEDLFKEKPVVNIEDLLKSSPMAEIKNETLSQPEIEPVNETVEEEPEVSMPQPKFFNMFPPSEQEEPKEDLKQETTSMSEMSFNINDIESFKPIENGNHEEMPQSSPNISHEAPSYNNVGYGMPQNDNYETPNTEMPTFDVNINNVVPSNNMDQFENNINSNNIYENNNIEQPKMPEPEFNFDNFNPIIHNDFAGEEIKEEDIEFFEEEEPQEIEQPKNEESPRQMKDVIRIIRDCNDIIESYGYKIETEEFDLETMYQVIFKIYKN